MTMNDQQDFHAVSRSPALGPSFARPLTLAARSFAGLAGLLVVVPTLSSAQQAPEDANAIPKYQLLNISKDPQRAKAGKYKLDPHHSSVTAKLAHMELSRYTVRFNSISGQFSYDPLHPAASKIEIVLDPKSIDTGNQAFDKRIATRYFEADKFPAIKFTSTNIKISGSRGEVEGLLDFHGVKKPIVLHTTYRGFTSLDDQPRMGFSAEATFRRSEFDVGVWTPLEADEVTVLIETEFRTA